MPPPTQQLRQRLPLVLFLLISLALLATTIFTSSDDYSQYAALDHHDDQQTTRLRVQPVGTLAEDISLSPQSHDDTAGKRLRVGLAGAGGTKGKQVVGLAAGSAGDDLSFTVQRRDDSSPSSSPAPPPHSSPAQSSSPHPALAYVRTKLDSAASSLGDLILGVFGFDEDDWFGMGDFEGDPSETGIDGGGLASWSESSVYVERTNSLHPSRPSSFGPHLLTEPLRGLLYPVESVLPTDMFGCQAHPIIPAPVHEPSTPWVALVQRGECPFSQKVRFAQEHGAMAVVFGDESEEQGGISGGHGLLTPWSPEDSSDITIPSTFVSRASYLSLLRTWQDEQDLVKRVDALVAERSRHREGLVGLEVVLSKDEVFAWPLLDLLFMLLFLPSLLTLVTVFIQRVRVARASKAERAPKDAVARLPVFRWGEAEKPDTPATADGASPPTTLRNLDQDEEREVGIAHVPVSSADEDPTEETALLAHDADEHAHTPSVFQRLASRLPTSLTRHLPSRLRPAPPPTPHRARARATRRYPSLTECPFCLSDFEAGDLVMELPCSHVFHAEEIETWLQQQRGICPICRMSVLAPPQDDAVVGSAVAVAAAAAEHEGQGLVDGVALPVSATADLVEPLRAPPGTTDSTTGASPVASSSSVPLEGMLAHSSAAAGPQAD
ncbi:hypothetical protein JCM8208_001484 [Rhodotorula glutinis]